MECKSITGLTGGVPEQIAHQVSLNRGKISYHKQKDGLYMAGEKGAHISSTCFPIVWHHLATFNSKQTAHLQSFFVAYGNTTLSS